MVLKGDHGPWVSGDWHGIRQLRSGWADGPAYITQCPIQTGQSYVYNFTVVGQRGTFFWHAHISWLRSTLYGPLVILPKLHVPYPFPKPHQQIPIVFGEWFNTDTEAIINQALQTGGGPNVSDAYTINGLPGPLYNCSAKDTFKLMVKPGKTYLLRLVNAALNDELFFSIANHTLKIVDVDAIYVKPFETDTLVITPGQTTNVLLTTKPHFPNSTFYMMARPYATGQGTFDNSTVAALLEYESPSKSHTKNLPLFKLTLPALNDTSFAANFSKKLLSLASAQFPANVPQKVDKQFFFTVGLGTNPCDQNQTCQGPNGTKFAASINNISFVMPTTALLQSHFSGQSNGVYSPMFPITPLNWFNYTGNPPNNTMVSNGTKVMVLPYNTSVELVMQDTSILGAESHPLHLHGFNFFIVGQGFGNYDANKDPKNFNLVDPIERNTVGVPSGGWVAIRFLADNPGVWFMHCHLEVHTSWGLKMAWLVLDGKLANQKLLPPPADLPQWTPTRAPRIKTLQLQDSKGGYNLQLYGSDYDTKKCRVAEIDLRRGRRTSADFSIKWHTTNTFGRRSKSSSVVYANLTITRKDMFDGIELRSGWADGPAYTTQCPLQTGQSCVYNFTVVGQRETLYILACLRSTLYGPILILPKLNLPYPFSKPHKEVPIILGNKNVLPINLH
ncbi:hypothetical protein LguiB_035287 [Lonicera macranthoides]